MAFEINESVYNSQKENILKIKKSLDKSVSDMNAIVKNISSNWNSPASNELCKNIKKSSTSFQTYIDDLNDASKFMDNFLNQVNKVKGKRS